DRRAGGRARDGDDAAVARRETDQQGARRRRLAEGPAEARARALDRRLPPRDAGRDPPCGQGADEAHGPDDDSGASAATARDARVGDGARRGGAEARRARAFDRDRDPRVVTWHAIGEPLVLRERFVVARELVRKERPHEERQPRPARRDAPLPDALFEGAMPLARALPPVARVALESAHHDGLEGGRVSGAD